MGDGIEIDEVVYLSYTVNDSGDLSKFSVEMVLVDEEEVAVIPVRVYEYEVSVRMVNVGCMSCVLSNN